MEQLQKTGLPLGALTHEAAAAQYEINLNLWMILLRRLTIGFSCATPSPAELQALADVQLFALSRF